MSFLMEISASCLVVSFQLHVKLGSADIFAGNIGCHGIDHVQHQQFRMILLS